MLKKSILANWEIPLLGNLAPTSHLAVMAGDVVFIVGANGCGKSGLVQWLYQNQRNQLIRRIAAHRQNWMDTGAISLTAADRRSYETNFRSWDQQPTSRWKITQPAQRQQSVLFDIVGAENEWNRQIAKLVSENKLNQASNFSKKEEPPLTRINRLLKAGRLTAQIDVNDKEVVVARHGDDPEFDSAKLSDGERNAFLLMR